MNNLKVGMRLGLGFALVVALLVVVAIVGATRLGTVDAMTIEVVRNRLPKVLTVNKLVDNMHVATQAVRNMLLTSDSAVMARENQAIDALAKSNSEGLAELDKTVTSAEGKTRLKAVVEARGAYLATLTEIRNLAMSGRKSEATALLFGPMQGHQERYVAAFQALNEFQIEQTTKSGKEADDIYHQALWIISLISALAVLAAAVVAWLVTRSITRPLNQAVELADRVAAGDLTSRIDATGKDETAQLLSALQRMNDNLVNIVGQVRSGTDSIATATRQMPIPTGTATRRGKSCKVQPPRRCHAPWPMRVPCTSATST